MSCVFKSHNEAFFGDWSASTNRVPIVPVCLDLLVVLVSQTHFYFSVEDTGIREQTDCGVNIAR